MTSFYLDNEYTLFAGIILSLLALSTWVLVVTGVTSVAAPALMAVGAYTGALITTRWDQLPFGVAVVAGMGAAALAGAIVALPAARLGSLYLALMTLAVVQAVGALAAVLPFTGGALGLSGIPAASTPAVMWISFGVACLLAWRLSRTQAWRFMNAIGESELGAASVGLRLTRMRFVMFMLSGAIAGLAGVLEAHLELFLSPDNYGFGRVTIVLAAVFLGGTGAWWGPILGSALVIALPEVLRPLGSVSDYAYGAIFVIVLIWLPGGLVGAVRALRTSATGFSVRLRPSTRDL